LNEVDNCASDFAHIIPDTDDVPRPQKGGEMRTLSLLALVFTVQRDVQLCVAWGCDGHRMTAAIAEKLLTTAATKQVQEILAYDKTTSMNEVACWPDEIRMEAAYRWSDSLHFVDIPDGVCSFKYARDCKDDTQEIGRCAVGAIYNYTQRVQVTTGFQRAEALKFLVHFVGDIHQPLHVAFTNDKGGNMQIIAWDSKKQSSFRRRVQRFFKGNFRKFLGLGERFGLTTPLELEDSDNVLHENLHAIWDTQMIKQEMHRLSLESFSEYSDVLLQRIQTSWSVNITQWKNCAQLNGKKDTPGCPDVWAEESISLACRYAYKDQGEWLTPALCTQENPCSLGEEYFEKSDPIVEQRLAQGGIRLAMILNEMFSGDEERVEQLALGNTDLRAEV